MTDYDRVEYPSTPFPQCHPDRLAVIARLFGLSPVPVETSRVLEIGCGDGLNLIASALVLPYAQFLGVDVSQAAIRRGKNLVRELGLNNIRLERRDFRSLSRAKEFHYVIAHGIYSWIPADIRDTLLATIERVLHPRGIAFVSYNAYPGAYLRQMVREMAGLFADESMAGARAWLGAAQKLSTGPPLYRAVLADEAADMLRREDGALFHDDLAQTNSPCWFRDFISHAGSHGLDYVAEANLATTGASGLPNEALHGHKDRIRMEQYADFLRGRRFRQTLLCHAGQAVLALPESSTLNDCYAGGPLNAGVPQSDGTVEYASRVGGSYRTSLLGERCILESAAAAWPRYLPVNELGGEALPALVALFAANMIDLRTVPPPVSAEQGIRRGNHPEASPLARAQSLRGTSVTTLHHLEVAIGSGSLRTLLGLADGTRTRAGLIRDLGKSYPSESKDQVTRAVDQHLEDLRLYGLLTDPAK
jgi:SAM-dependent methyltransferase